ncbi:MAG: phosphonate C-P lyase system protein PhnL [Acidimicrobiia bacterium]
MAEHTSPSTVLRVRDLHKSFVLHAIDGRRIEALRGIDLDLHAGEHVALVGSSGAGKSTLLKSIYRTYLPDAGEVWLHRAGSEPVDLLALDDRTLATLRVREIGYVSQFLRAEPRRGVLDAVTRAGIRRGLGAVDAADAARHILEHLGIGEKLWHTFPTLLSGGEKQRVNLAAGIICPPPVLLLDEPVSALDPANRDAVLELIAELTGQGTSVLAVFHDLDAIERLAHRVIRLDRGHVAAVGSPADILAELSASIGAPR